jgi:hypothetical protein
MQRVLGGLHVLDLRPALANQQEHTVRTRSQHGGVRHGQQRRGVDQDDVVPLAQQSWSRGSGRTSRSSTRCSPSCCLSAWY